MGDIAAGRVRARYIDALPGRGKTFMLRALVLALRSPSSGRPLIVVNVAPTGVAASQYLGGFSAPETDGTTAHRRFRITVSTSWDSDDPSACQVTGGSDVAAALRVADACVWNELANARGADFEAVDADLRELSESDLLFGGVTFIGVGDFHQIPPIVIGATPESHLEHLVHQLPLWRHVTVTTLRESVRMGGDPEYSDLLDAPCTGT
ncbi:unnamed protein product [Laminaria digitata]